MIYCHFKDLKYKRLGLWTLNPISYLSQSLRFKTETWESELFNELFGKVVIPKNYNYIYKNIGP